MKLFQYWDSENPPDEVIGWINGFRAETPDFEHFLFNAESAAAFIKEHCGDRELRAFQACAVPAMQSDYFRLCALDVFGGIYIDADHQRKRSLAELIAPASHALIFEWSEMFANGFMMFRTPRDPFVQACLALATSNIETRELEAVFTATGPGVLNAVRAIADPTTAPRMLELMDNFVSASWRFPVLLDHARELIAPTPELVDSYRAITLIHAITAGDWIGTDQPAYKSTSRHWLHWQGSIYRDLPPG